MKKVNANLLKTKKIYFNEYGQILFVKSYSSIKTKKFYQFLLKKGS
ncbi:MAG: hypothetical protein RL262_1546 [Bacteroidota bacterium]